MTDTFVQVAVEAPLPEPLTYKWPESLGVSAEVGQSVIVPMGKRQLSGVVVETLDRFDSTEFQLKEVLSLHEERPQLPLSYIQWIKWMSEYYLFPMGQVFAAAFPPLKKKGRGSKKLP